MATSQESEASKKFIDKQRELYGEELYIEKVINNVKVGEPDIRIIFRGMSLFAESKSINAISFINVHPFKEIQLYNLTMKEKGGAFCIGLLLCDKVTKYIMHNQIKSEHITREEFLNAKEFNLLEIWEEWYFRLRNKYGN